jgi:hypothetical protein
MAFPQWQRAQFIIEQMKEADRTGTDIAAYRSEIKRETELKFRWCHDCLLLAVYGLYKNGFIEDTCRAKAQQIDFAGFDGHESADIHHAFDGLALLVEKNDLTATDLKRQLGGEKSIYSFVAHYFCNGLLRL